MRKSLLLAATAALALAACGEKKESDAAAEAETDAAAETETAGPAADLPDEAKTQAELKADFEKLAAENLAASKAFLEENKARLAKLESAQRQQLAHVPTLRLACFSGFRAPASFLGAKAPRRWLGRWTTPRVLAQRQPRLPATSCLAASSLVSPYLLELKVVPAGRPVSVPAW